MKMKATMIGLLTALLLATAASGASFARTRTYEDGTFTDIPATEWYAAEVQNTYSLGLMSGTGNNLFEPNGNVTLAECITVACRARAIYTDEAIDTASDGEWYAPYVAFAKAKGIITSDYDNYERAATRAEVASVFYNAMPSSWYEKKNDVNAVPDVAAARADQNAILTLYRAGVVMGSNEYGFFYPENTITRAEMAAIINRVALPENRLEKTLPVITEDDAYTMVSTSGMNSEREGIAPGWRMDNRGGIPRTALRDAYGALYDIDKEAGSAYIREVNKTSTGVLKLETTFTAIGDGAYIEWKNEDGKTVWRVETKNGKWNLLDGNGKLSPVYDIGEDESDFSLCLLLDLDNDTASLRIGNTECGTLPTLTKGADTNVTSLTFGTTKEGTPVIVPASVRVLANYAVYENLTFCEAEKLPYGWYGEKAYNQNSHIVIENGGHTGFGFGALSGNVVAEFEMQTPQNEQNTTYVLTSEGKAVCTFTADGKNFTVNGTTVYENYYMPLWYRFRFELDTAKETIDVKVNGRYVAKDIPFAAKTASVDAFGISNAAETVELRRITVFRAPEHEDYVPAPVIPKGADDYLIGMNVCSLWWNGWDCISAYPDTEPVLGYYDESNPETADWEIKYLTEHGVDFQGFCMFFGKDNNYLLRPNGDHLYYGYMNAKYAELSKYCVIWEAENSYSPYSLDEWKTLWVPYFVENFFKDDRYVVIDNKPLVLVFGPKRLAERLGSAELVKQCFDYIDEEVKKLGFDGVLFIAGAASDEYIADMGFDGVYRYGWGIEGYRADYNKEMNLQSAANPALYTVPTVSVGFNNIAWGGDRHPMMSAEDNLEIHKWVRDTYLPMYAKEDWQKNFVMLSNWNEYGEGTYLMPTTDEKGFRYLDTIRTVYTKETENKSVDVVPTDVQKYRINHLYPQNMHLLRKQGVEKNIEETFFIENMDVLSSIDYSKQSGVLAWGTDGAYQSSEGFCGTSNCDDPSYVIESYPETLDLSTVGAFSITLKSIAGAKVDVYYTTSESGEWSEEKSVHYIVDSDGFDTTTIRMDDPKYWKGNLVKLRIDPVNQEGVEMILKEIIFYKGEEKTVSLSDITVNDRLYTMSFEATPTNDGDYLIPFDPDTGMDFFLGLYHVWNADRKELTLAGKTHTIVFTVGKDTYTLDGKEQKLSSPLTAFDGLPNLPMKRLCNDLGYTFSFDETNGIVITTPDKAYFDQKKEAAASAEWNFDMTADTEGWTSDFMSMMVSDGYLRCKPTSASTDPKIFSSPVNFKTKKYTTLEYRVRYDYSATTVQKLTMYFLTNRDGRWDEDKVIMVPLNGFSSNGEWETYTVDLTTVAGYANTITALRFDPFDAVGSIDVDYIRFIADPDYVDPEEGFAVLDGDAEGENNFDSSLTEIVTDTDMPSNHVFAAVPPNDDWLYIISSYPVIYTPGATYTAELDVRAISHGPELDPDGEVSTTMCFDAVYVDPDGGASDHIENRLTLKVEDGWKHWTFEFTIPKNATDRTEDRFSIYSNPYDDKGVGYCFDNLSVTEIKP